MADWRKLAASLILTDGVIEAREAAIVKRELTADGKVTAAEAEFLVDLRRAAKRAVPEFHQFVFEVLKRAALADGVVSATEAAWLKAFLLADGRVDEMEKQFLRDLKAEARQTSPEFDALYNQYAGKIPGSPPRG